MANFKKNEVIKRRPVSGYEDYYEVSECGHVFRVKGGMGARIGFEIKPYNDSKGYKHVKLYADCQGKHFLVHRLVAIAFIPNPLKLPQINHKDGVTDNNHASNLEWCDNSYNLRHAHYSLGIETKGHEKRRIIGTHLASGVMIWMPSIMAAARFINGRHGNIAEVCYGRRSHHKEWVFRFAE